MKQKLIQTAAILAAAFLTLGGCSQVPGANVETASQEKAEQTLSKMTFEEKVQLLHGPITRLVPKSKRPEDVAVGAAYIEGIPRLGIPTLTETDASLGVSNLLETRKGDVATALPSGLSLASS